MKKIGYIYKITSPSGKSYIGQTTNFEKRMKTHSYGRGETMLSRSVKKYGWEAHTVDVLWEGKCTDEQLDTLEVNFIELYDTFYNGLNLTEGGEGRRGPLSEEHKAKLSIAMKGRRRSVDVVARIAVGHMISINQHSRDGIFIKTWPSIREAGESLRINRGDISNCLRGKLRTAGGYIWKYEEG